MRFASLLWLFVLAVVGLFATVLSALWYFVLFVGTAAVAGFVLTNTDSSVRQVVVVSFLLVVPGLAWVRLLRLRDRTEVIMLAVATSVVIDACVSGALVYGGIWSADAALAIVLALSLAGGVVELTLDERTARSGAEP